MKTSRYNYLLPFIDLLTCTLGAVILIAVIFSLIKNPKVSPVFSKFILGQVVVEGEGKLGFLMTTPNNYNFTLFTPHRRLLSNVPGETAESIEIIESHTSRKAQREYKHYFIVIKKPLKGRWTFRPYYVDINGRNAYTPLRLEQIQFWTINTRYEMDSQDKKIAIDQPFHFAETEINNRTYQIDVLVK